MDKRLESLIDGNLQVIRNLYNGALAFEKYLRERLIPLLEPRYQPTSVDMVSRNVALNHSFEPISYKELVEFMRFLKKAGVDTKIALKGDKPPLLVMLSLENNACTLTIYVKDIGCKCKLVEKSSKL